MDVSFYLSVLEGDERETYTGESRPSKGAQVSLIYPALFMLSVTPFQMISSRNKQPQITNNTVCVSGGLRKGYTLQTQTGLKFMVILLSQSPSPGIIGLSHRDQHE